MNMRIFRDIIFCTLRKRVVSFDQRGLEENILEY